MKTSVISFLSRFSNAKSFISKYPNAIFFALALITLTYIFTKTDVDFTSILYHKKIAFSSIISHALCHVFDALILLIPFVLLPQRFKWLEWIC